MEEKLPYEIIPSSGSEVLERQKPNDSGKPIKEKGGATQVIEYEKWDCVIKDVFAAGVRVFATDSSKHYNSRYLTFKKDYFEKWSQESISSLFEGQQLEWVIKRIRRPSGQEIKVEEINVFKRLRIPEWQLMQQVKQQMEDLKYLFED